MTSSLRHRMTNEQFAAWVKRHFCTNTGRANHSAAAEALGINREAVDSLIRGHTRNGAAYPVRKHIELACAAWNIGLRGYDDRLIAVRDSENLAADDW